MASFVNSDSDGQYVWSIAMLEMKPYYYHISGWLRVQSLMPSCFSCCGGSQAKAGRLLSFSRKRPGWQWIVARFTSY